MNIFTYIYIYTHTHTRKWNELLYRFNRVTMVSERKIIVLAPIESCFLVESYIAITLIVMFSNMKIFFFSCVCGIFSKAKIFSNGVFVVNKLGIKEL